jgi:hypothetical protein
VALAGVVSLILLVVSAPGAGADEEIYQIENNNSPYCLAVPGASTKPGVKLIQWNCDSHREQLWKTDVWTSWYRIKNYETGLCLAIGNGSSTPGAPAIQWPCNGGYEQLWSVGDDNLNPRTLVNYESRQCLAVSGGSKARGAAVIQWPCNSGPEQDWVFFPPGAGA